MLYEIKDTHLFFSRLASPYVRGSCISINVGLNIGQNYSVVSIKFIQKVNGEFRDFDQNATFSNIRSVWSFKYDGSVNSKFTFIN